MLAEMREDALFDQVRDPTLQAWIATNASTTLHAGRDARRRQLWHSLKSVVSIPNF